MGKMFSDWHVRKKQMNLAHFRYYLFWFVMVLATFIVGVISKTSLIESNTNSNADAGI